MLVSFVLVCVNNFFLTTVVFNILITNTKHNINPPFTKKMNSLTYYTHFMEKDYGSAWLDNREDSFADEIPRESDYSVAVKAMKRIKDEG